MTNHPDTPPNNANNRQSLETVDIHFAGDSGDGMQVLGMRFSEASAAVGNDLRTFPDYPAEIRAPQGTLAGVSGFQISFSAHPIHTQGDNFDALVAMNPAAFQATKAGLKKGGLLLVDDDKFVAKEYRKLGIEGDLLEAATDYRIVQIPLTQLTITSLADIDVSRSKARKCKNMFVLGVLFWLYNRPLEPTKLWIEQKFTKEPELIKANQQALRAGYNYAVSTELFTEYYTVKKAALPKGLYRQVTGNQALVLGALSVACQQSHSMLLSGYPITPASDILHEMSRYPQLGIKTFQAEDEVAAIGAGLGAAFAGELAITATSGPGLDLMGEALGLAAMVELPLVVVDVQRAGPSTGMPTKVEQSDLNVALSGRHGECPIPVIAAKSAGDCFTMARLAFKIAVEYMTPVILLSDAYLANCAEPWRIPDQATLELEQFNKNFVQSKQDDCPFAPYQRDEKTMRRPWAIPGTEQLMHRIGGLEKKEATGEISYDPINHEKMVKQRQAKVDHIQTMLPPLEIIGPATGDILVIGWGSVYGACVTAVEQLQLQGKAISYCHCQSLYPLQVELTNVLKKFQQVLVVELNNGQLCQRLRAEFLVPAIPVNKIQGKPFQVQELVAVFNKHLEEQSERVAC